jgi:hypothetical protein
MEKEIKKDPKDVEKRLLGLLSSVAYTLQWLD